MTRSELTRPDPTERLGPDDMATLRDEQFLQAALLQQQERAVRTPVGRPGWCSNCGEACVALAVYCDDDCRDDHQHRLAVAAKTQARR